MIGSNVDILEHLTDLMQAAEGCDTVVELGVRNGFSTKALLMGGPKRLISYDIDPCPNWNELKELADRNKVEWQFYQKSSHEVKIPRCDFLFIDSEHTYECLKRELVLHKKRAKKIGFHDTMSFPQINKAISEEVGKWPVIKEKLNNNGFLLIRKP